MGLDHSWVLTAGTRVLKQGEHTLLHNTLLVIPPCSSKPLFFVGSPRSLQQGSSHATHTSWVAADLTSGHLAHAGNHKHGTAGHSQGRKSAPQAADV